MSETESQTDEKGSLRKRIPWRRLASVVGMLLLLAIVVPFVVYAVPQVAGGESSYVVLSGSMEPTISPGDAIVTKTVNPANVKVGDVITFRRGDDNRPTTHRVIEIVNREDGRAFRTQGDAVEDPDQQLVSPSQVRGRVMTVGGFLFVIPLIGHLIQFANTQVGFAALFVVPIVLLVLSEIWEIASSTRGDTAATSQGGGDSGAVSDHADTKRQTSESTTASDEQESDSAGITFTATELELGLAILIPFLAYSIWVAYVTLEIWAFAVAGSVGTTFLLLTAIYFFGGSDQKDSKPAKPADKSGDGDSRDSDESGEKTLEVDVEEEVARLEELHGSGEPEESRRESGGGIAAMRPGEDGTQSALTHVESGVDDESETGTGNSSSATDDGTPGGESG